MQNLQKTIACASTGYLGMEEGPVGLAQGFGEGAGLELCLFLFYLL